jgi:hypothetical protein
MIAEEFWILDCEGKPLYTFTLEGKTRSDLLSGFFRTIQSFARNIIEDDQEHVSFITLGEFNYNFHYNAIYNLYFILKCAAKTKRKAIKSLISTIENLFIEDYRAELVKPEIDPSKFEKFQSKIEKFFVKDMVDQMAKRMKSNSG